MDDHEYLAWRAFAAGIRIAAHINNVNPDALQSDSIKLLRDIANSDTTLAQSPADLPHVESMAPFLVGLTNTYVYHERDLAQLILAGCIRAMSDAP